MNNDEYVFETTGEKLKRFLTGGRIYSQLAVAVVCALVFVLSAAGIAGIYSNVSQAKNVQNLTGLDVNRDLDGQYVTGNAYKFLSKLGYIAESDRAATHYYYFMYIDGADGNQYLTLVEAPKEMDSSIQQVIDAFLNYAQNPDGNYLGSGFEDMSGRFKNMTSQEKTMMDSGISSLGLGQELRCGYTLKIGPLPKASEAIGYWFIAVIFGAAMVVGAVLFVYGLHLEHLREEENKSPYPYQNRKKK